MAGIDEILERLVTDTDFRNELRTDPQAALAGYELSRDDLALLASQLDEGETMEHGVEQRTSKSAMASLLMGLAGEAPTAPAARGEEIRIESWSWGSSGESFNEDVPAEGLTGRGPEQQEDVLGANEKWLRGDAGTFAGDEVPGTGDYGHGDTHVHEGPAGAQSEHFYTVEIAEDDLEPDGLVGPETEPPTSEIELEPVQVTSLSVNASGTDDAAASEDAITASRFGISMDGVQLGDDVNHPVVLGQLPNDPDDTEIYDYPGLYGEKGDEVPATPSGEHIVQYPESDLDFAQARAGDSGDVDGLEGVEPPEPEEAETVTLFLPPNGEDITGDGG